MKAISRRQKLLLGGLGIVVVAWTVDYLSGGGKTATARAASSATAAPLPAAPDGPAVSDVAELLNSIDAAPQTAAPLEVDLLTRDLFLPTDALKAACNAMETNAAMQTAAAAQQDECGADETPFEQRHQLQGILTGGRLPLAIIDGQLFATGARLDGYTVARIERDRVVCARGQREVVLVLNAPGE